MANSTERSVCMTEGPILPNMLRFFLPIMLGTLLQQLYSMVDAIILGKFVGKVALAAVGGSDIVIINLIVGFFVALSSGAAIVISQHYGAKEDEPVRQSVHTAMTLAVIIGAVMSVLGIFLAPRFLGALDTPEDTLAYSVDYLRWYFAGMIPSMIYNMGSSILRAVGDSRKPLLFLAVCTAANTVLDLLLVAVFRMEVAGAAIATSLSQLICAVLVISTLRRQKNACRLELRRLCLVPSLLRRMLLIGLPAGVQSTMYGVTNLFIQKAINLLGTDTVAAWSILWKIDGIYWPISGAIGIAVMTFCGQNFGAHKRERIFRCTRAGLFIHLSVSAFLGLVIALAWNPVAGLFSSDPNVIAQGRQAMLLISTAYCLFSCIEVFSSAMRGCGTALKPAILTLLGVCVLRMVLLFTVTFPHLSNQTIAMCYPITWAVTSALFFLYYKFGRWLPTLSQTD